MGSLSPLMGISKGLILLNQNYLSFTNNYRSVTKTFDAQTLNINYDSITTERLHGASQFISDSTGNAREVSVCFQHSPSLTIGLLKYIIK